MREVNDNTRWSILVDGGNWLAGAGRAWKGLKCDAGFSRETGHG